VDDLTRADFSAVGERPAPLGDRILAHVIDALILFLPLLALWALVLRSVPFIVGTIVSNGLSLSYFVFLEAFRGRTLGKQLRRLRVRDAKRGLPTVEQTFRRNLYLMLGIVPGLVGSVVSLAVIVWIAVTIGRDPVGRQGIHDRFAGTFVTQAERL
jgi:uncharacterized RDD family membrane protein YckC